MIRHLILATAIISAPHVSICGEADTNYVEHITALLNEQAEPPVRLTGSDAAVTKARFKPPVEILIVAKTDSTNLRLSYAADQVIFNWEADRSQLRIDGGPANGVHTRGAGSIPTKRYVTIRWTVTPTRQTIHVDDELRFEHKGDYSKIDSPVSVFSIPGAKVTVKSIKVRQLPPGTQ